MNQIASATVRSVLVDQRNFVDELPNIMSALSACNLCGLDIETHNANAHPGIHEMNKGKKLVFDVKRTTLCGLSIYPGGSPTAWYFNLGHADAENRLPWGAIQPLLDAKPKHAKWIVHNAAFERTMLGETVGWEMQDYICTLQMAVSAYGPDEYPLEKFITTGLGEMANLIPAIRVACFAQQETPDMQDLLQKVIGKASNAAHSYNGWASDIAYGYNLKKAVKSFFGYEMETYEQCLRGRDHMGQLTGEETVSYGADDAIWCLRLYHALLEFMLASNPAVVKTFFEQELPMVEVYSEGWRHGVNIDPVAVRDAELANRVRFADCTRRLKRELLQLLPFDAAPNEKLAETEGWYRKNGHTYRDKLTAWIKSADHADDFKQAWQVRGSIPNEWAKDTGHPENKAGLNLGHYMPMRVIMYDLFRTPPIMEQGKVQSDADTRGRLMERMKKQGNSAALAVLSILGEIATIEQASKLYLLPYQKLVDPESGKIHPQLTSELSTRRMAMKDPNSTQLARRGETVYIRGLYKPDHPDHVIVSLDWSQIELVTAGEFSQDEGFLEVYRQLPYKDLHEIAAAGCLDVSISTFQALRSNHTAEHPPHLLTSTKGEQMEPAKAYKYWRTELGKGSNFESAYGNLLNTVGTRMGWDRDKVVEMTEKHKATFPRLWEWKAEVAGEARDKGFVTLADGHRRTRYEATPEWAAQFRDKWARMHDPAVSWFADKAIRRIQTRAGNQSVNALVQGICAAVAKRSILRARKRFQELGWTPRMARFMFAVHDELVFSVHRDLAVQLITEVSAIMKNHPDIYKSVVLDCTPSVGLTFAPWDEKKAPFGQVELREAPPLPFIPEGMLNKPIPTEMWPQVITHLFEMRERA